MVEMHLQLGNDCCGDTCDSILAETQVNITTIIATGPT